MDEEFEDDFNGNETVDCLLAIWKDIVLACMGRLQLHRECCPLSSSNDDRKKLLPEIAAISRQIDELCERGRELEGEQSFKIGISALIGDHSKSDVLYVATALLIMARLSGSLSDEVRHVARWIQIVAPMDPVSALRVRDSIRHPNGALVPFVRLWDIDFTIDQSFVTLSEQALSVALSRQPSEFENAMAVLGRSNHFASTSSKRRFPF